MSAKVGRYQLIKISVGPDGNLNVASQGNLTMAEVFLGLEYYKMQLIQAGIREGMIPGFAPRKVG